MKLLTISIVFIISCIILLTIASANGGTKECVEWKTIYPTPTPIPMSVVYSEWIPVPGTSPGTGHGWIRATELADAQRQWPPPDMLTAHILTDAEYGIIEEAHGLRITQGNKMGYGFPPRQGFPLLYGGVVLKNEWLPKRLQ